MLPTPHIEADSKSKFAKTVIMPGDPLRARYIAEHYLEDAIRVNTVRGMLGYTGTYKGHKVSVMGSGMGVPSMGIYSYELFKFYDVDNIVRVGSAGSYNDELCLYDVVLVEESYGETDYIEIMTGDKSRTIKPTAALNKKLLESAKKIDVELKKVKTHCTDIFYRPNFDDYKVIRKEFGCDCVEMETAALFTNARVLGKSAAAIMTISDCLVTGKSTSAKERQNSFTKMMEVALGIVEEK